MPELPDVESARRYLARHAAGRRVVRIEVTDASIVRNAEPRDLAGALRGRTFLEPDRIGKWLLCWTDGPGLLLHLGMTGELNSSVDVPSRHRWDRVIVELDDGTEIRYRNMRKLGGVWLALNDEGARAVVGHLGPDALAIRRTAFLERLAGRRGGVKAALMDQTFVAGVGNLLADEILWQARLHPRRLIDTLAEDDRRELFRVLHAVLKESVDRYDSVPRKRSWLFPVRGLPDARCPRCGTPLERLTAAGRTTWLCPSCQSEVSAGRRPLG